MFSSAGAYRLALCTYTDKKSSDDRPRCLENPRPEGAESTLTENAASPFSAEPAQLRLNVSEHVAPRDSRDFRDCSQSHASAFVNYPGFVHARLLYLLWIPISGLVMCSICLCSLTLPNGKVRRLMSVSLLLAASQFSRPAQVMPVLLEPGVQARLQETTQLRSLPHQVS
jgi:hypothetical protein